MTEKAKKAGSLTALAVGGTINIAAVCSMFYEGGIKASQLAEVRERMSANESRVSAAEAAIMKTREGLEDKLSLLLRAVSRIEGQLERRK